MTPEDLFKNYVKNYYQYGEAIKRKEEHSFRVQELSKVIATSLNLNKKDIEVASLCGLLHDIGRFEQWKNYQSFSDLKTIDHGSLGEKILKDNNFINNFTKTNHNIILKSVKYHNKYKVPNNLSDRNKLFINITRDADKIDIFNIFASKILEINYDQNKEINKKVYNLLLNKKQIDRHYLKSKTDNIGEIIGMVFDLKYKKSYQLLKENNYINIIIDDLLKDLTNNKLINQLKEIKVLVNDYIEEMITC